MVEVAGNLWCVAQGVDNLVAWAEGMKAVWNRIECTGFSDELAPYGVHLYEIQ